MNNPQIFIDFKNDPLVFMGCSWIIHYLQMIYGFIDHPWIPQILMPIDIYGVFRKKHHRYLMKSHLGHFFKHLSWTRCKRLSLIWLNLNRTEPLTKVSNLCLLCPLEIISPWNQGIGDRSVSRKEMPPQGQGRCRTETPQGQACRRMETIRCSLSCVS